MNRFSKWFLVILGAVLLVFAWSSGKRAKKDRLDRERAVKAQSAVLEYLKTLGPDSAAVRILGQFQGWVGGGSNGDFTRGSINPGLWLERTASFQKGRVRTFIHILTDAIEPYRILIGSDPPNAFETPPPGATILYEGGQVFYEYERDKRYFPAGGREKMPVRLEIQVLKP